MMQRLALAALLLLPPVLLFAPGLHYPFLNLDDIYAVPTNPGIRDLSWDGIRFLFLEDTRDMRYFPVTYLSWAVDYRLFGVDPFGYHLTDLALHLLNVGLVFALVRRLTDDTLIASTAGVLFAIHPLQVESVAWISSRKNLMFTLFFLLATFAYLGYTRLRDERRSVAWAWLSLSVVLYVVSCLSKTAGITLPGALLVIDLHRESGGSRSFAQLLRRHLPSKLVFVPPALLIYAITRLLGGDSPLATDLDFSRIEWSAIIGHNLAFYLVKTILPTQLGVFYPVPSGGGVPAIFWAHAIAALALVAATVWAWARGHRYLFLGLGWYFVTILPMAVFAAFFSDVPILVADRYYYQSAIGVGIVVGVGLSVLWREQPRLRRGMAVGAAAVGVAYFAVAAEHRSKFRNTIVLFESLLENHPSDEFYYRLAIEYAEVGREADAFAALDAAETARHQIFFQDLTNFQVQLAELFRRRDDFERAARFMRAAIEAAPNRFEPFETRTPVAWRYLAHLEEEAGDERAAAAARARADAAPPPEVLYLEYAWMQFAPDAARRFLENRVASAPDDAVSLYCLGVLDRLQGRERLGQSRIEHAARLGYP